MLHMRVSTTTTLYITSSDACRQRHYEAFKKSKEEKINIELLWTCHNYHFSVSTKLYRLRTHIDYFHPEDYMGHVPHDWANLLPSHVEEELRLASSQQPQLQLVMVPYDAEHLQEKLIWWLVSDDQVCTCTLNQCCRTHPDMCEALHVLENKYLRGVFQLLRPDLDLSDIPDQISTRNLIVQQFLNSIKELSTEVQEAQSAISFTTNYCMNKGTFRKPPSH